MAAKRRLGEEKMDMRKMSPGTKMKDSFGEFQICRGLEGTGKCWWCGGDFPDKRLRRFCSGECGDRYRETYYWAWAAPAAIERAGGKCEDCGEGYAEVHHIVPLRNAPRHFNVKNEPGNLIVLCRVCHGKRHRVPTKNSRELRIEKGQLVLGLPDNERAKAKNA